MNKDYEVFSFGSPTAAVIMALQKLTMDHIDTALKLYTEQEAVRIGTVIGITNDGLFFSATENWNPSLPNAFDGIGMTPWVQIHELLGNVPDGTTGEFLEGKGRNH